MSQKTVTGSIALTKLVHAPYKSSKGADCIMIPIAANKLEIDDKGGVYLPIRVIVRDEQDKFGQNGFIAKAIGTKEYKDMSDADKETLKDNKSELAGKLTPILGNIKDWSSGGGNATSGNVSDTVHQAPAKGEPDDLPF